MGPLLPNRKRKGKLSLAAIKRAGLYVGREFALVKAADKDRDGFLSKDEFVDFVLPEINEDVLAVAMQDALALMDIDNDGKVNRTEFGKSHRPGDFKLLDV